MITQSLYLNIKCFYLFILTLFFQQFFFAGNDKVKGPFRGGENNVQSEVRYQHLGI